MVERRTQKRMTLGHLFAMNYLDDKSGELVLLNSSNLSRKGVSFE